MKTNKEYLYNKDEMTSREYEIAEHYKKIGLEHSRPSPETIKLFGKMEKKIDELTKSVNDLNIKIIKLPSEILEKANDKFASKITEKIVYSMVTLILVGVVGAWINIVVIKNQSKIDLKDVQKIVNDAILNNNNKYFEE